MQLILNKKILKQIGAGVVECECVSFDAMFHVNMVTTTEHVLSKQQCQEMCCDNPTSVYSQKYNVDGITYPCPLSQTTIGHATSLGWKLPTGL